jgi:hypothetical protein
VGNRHDDLVRYAAGKETMMVGDILREWRVIRGFSQLDLAMEAEVSARHLSFLESGR